MKREKWFSVVCAAVLAFLVSFGAVGCMTTGFFMTDVPLAAVGLCCALCAAVCALCTALRLGWIPCLAGGVLTLVLLIWGDLGVSFETLIFRISDLYDRGYGWGVVTWSDRELLDCSMALMLLGCLLSGIIAALLVRRKGGFFSIILGAVPLALCLVLTDTVPALWCIFLLLGGLVIILLSQRVRKRDEHQGNVLTAILCIPVALALTVLFVLSPREGYNGQELAQKLEDWVVSLFQEEEDPIKVEVPDPLSWPTAGGESNGLQEINLGAVGPKEENLSMVMKVKQNRYGYLYLRGATYNYYTGMSWIHSNAGEQWPYEKFDRTGEVREMTITTLKTHGVLYNTYAPTLDPAPVNGMQPNTKRQNSYTVTYMRPVQAVASWSQIFDHSVLGLGSQLDGATMGETSIHLQLPDSTAAWAGNILHDLDAYTGSPPVNAAEAYHLARLIAYTVRTSATYDLNTEQMPYNVDDFARWFMEEGDTGYCVHYATATAVLLRQAGIPSRYVTGYFTVVEPGETTVREKDAHAWVECYIPGVGWIPLESTPGFYDIVENDGIYENPDSEVTTPTEVTTEPTQDPNQPTKEPTQPTQESTKPASEPTATPDRDAQPPEENGPLLVILLLIALTIGVTVGQWRLRVLLRKRSFGKGSPNRQALKRWQYVCRLCRLLKRNPPEELLELAQKARFSAHRLTREELSRLSGFASQAVKQLRKHSAVKRFYYTVILALY